jgi:hypothetical protein
LGAFTVQATNATLLKKCQWPGLLILAFALTGWLGHQSPGYAVEEGGLFNGTSSAKDTPVPHPAIRRLADTLP